VATDRLQIRIDAVDNTKSAFSKIKGSIFNLRNALAGLGVGLVVKQFTDTGRAVENLSTRFKFLFGSAEQGAKAFDNLVKFAAKVPFSLEEISAASGNLAVVSKDAKELEKNLKIVGNVASVTGLDFRTTAEQIQRSFAGGISSADIFRERGVRALLGFQAGATVSIEETRKAFEREFGEGGRFAQATEVLSTTFTGTLSMLSDKIFKFKLETNRSGFFDFLKSGLKVINNLIEQNAKVFDDFADRLGKSLINATKGIILGSARIIDGMRPIFEFIGTALFGLFKIFDALPPTVREIGLIGFLILGTLCILWQTSLQAAAISSSSSLTFTTMTHLFAVRASPGLSPVGLWPMCRSISEGVNPPSCLSNHSIGFIARASAAGTAAAPKVEIPAIFKNFLLFTPISASPQVSP